MDSTQFVVLTDWWGGAAGAGRPGGTAGGGSAQRTEDLRGDSHAPVDALAGRLRALGGTIATCRRVRSVDGVRGTAGGGWPALHAS